LALNDTTLVHVEHLFLPEGVGPVVGAADQKVDKHLVEARMDFLKPAIKRRVGKIAIILITVSGLSHPIATMSGLCCIPIMSATFLHWSLSSNGGGGSVATLNVKH
jgi:hypothetical protein